MQVKPVNGYMVVREISTENTVDEDGRLGKKAAVFGCMHGLVVATCGNEHPYYGRRIAYEGQGIWFEVDEDNYGILVHEKQVVAVLRDDL